MCEQHPDPMTGRPRPPGAALHEGSLQIPGGAGARDGSRPAGTRCLAPRGLADRAKPGSPWDSTGRGCIPCQRTVDRALRCASLGGGARHTSAAEWHVECRRRTLRFRWGLRASTPAPPGLCFRLDRIDQGVWRSPLEPSPRRSPQRRGTRGERTGQVLDRHRYLEGRWIPPLVRVPRLPASRITPWRSSRLLLRGGPHRASPILPAEVEGSFPSPESRLRSSVFSSTIVFHSFSRKGTRPCEIAVHSR